MHLRVLLIAAGRTKEAEAPWAGGAKEQQRLLAAWVKSAIALAAGEQGQPTRPWPRLINSADSWPSRRRSR